MCLTLYVSIFVEMPWTRGPEYRRLIQQGFPGPQTLWTRCGPGSTKMWTQPVLVFNVGYRNTNTAALEFSRSVGTVVRHDRTGQPLKGFAPMLGPAGALKMFS